MCAFESILDQQRPLQALKAYLEKDAVPHALLFTGIEGVGKTTAAKTFAMACNCTESRYSHRGDGEDDSPVTNEKNPGEKPCLLCRSCRKILSGNHPDILEIKPLDGIIRIAQVRNLCHTLTMKPYEAKWRVGIISDAQAMNLEAGNALLKILEEPPERTLLILTALQRSDLLPTIASRCQHIRFNPISTDSLISILREDQGLEPDTAKVIAQLTSGSLSKAKTMARAGWIAKRNWLIGELSALTAKSGRSLLAIAENLSKDKGLWTDSLEVMESWYRDLVIYRFAPGKIINQDFTESIRNISKTTDTETVLKKIEAIETARKNIQSNFNSRLTLEVLMFCLATV